MRRRAEKSLTIGGLSERTGIPVKTLRFWSDKGLLPEPRRTRSNYRLWNAEQIARVELVRTLREAGLDHATIKKVLARDTSLRSALQLRLTAVEAHVASLTRISAALRAALERPEPDETDLRRLTAVTRLSSEECKTVISRFYEQIVEGLPVSDDYKQWMNAMVEASSPSLPADATREQLDAWVELTEILAAPDFVESMRANAADTWTADFDLAAFQKAQARIVKVAREARLRGVDHASEEAKAIVEEFVLAMAEASGKPADDAFRDRMRAKNDPRAQRYWQLVGIMKGEAPDPEGPFVDWQWLGLAITAALPYRPPAPRP